MMRIVLSLLLLAAPMIFGSPARADQIKRYAIIVANNRSLDPGVRTLRYADDDGVRYYELFRMETDKVALLTVMDEETARLHPDLAGLVQPPTDAQVFAAFTRFEHEIAARKAAGKRSELLLVYAGHGDVDRSGQGYITLQNSKLYRSDLYRRLIAKSKADYLHLIIDACKSYFLVNRRGGRRDQWKNDDGATSREQAFRAFLRQEELSAYPHVGVVLATSGDQATHEWARFRAGILSHELRSAISGAADINGDGRVEYSELHAFIASANARVRHPEARLEIFVRPPSANRNLPLRDLSRVSGARLLRFGPRVTGRFHVEDERGIRLVDLHKAQGVHFDLALDRRRRVYLRQRSKEARVAAGDGRVLVAALSFSDRRSAERGGSIDQSFRRDLFQTAYSRGFYDGFCVQSGNLPVREGAAEIGLRASEEAQAGRHSLSLGYLLGGALAQTGSLDHGIHLSYDIRLHRHISTGLRLQYGLAGATNADGERFSLSRFAALALVAADLSLHSRFSLRGELALGYQGVFGSGPVMLRGRRVEGSDPLGMRMELAAGARVQLSSSMFADVRGGMLLDLVTIEPEAFVHVSGFFALGLGLSF
jgi:hypothetical protein